MTPLEAARALTVDRSAWFDWFDTDNYKQAHRMPLPGQARREKAALDVMLTATSPRAGSAP